MAPLKSRDTIEDVAADWLVRCDRGLTPAEEVAFAAWLRADPRHRATFEAMEATWGMMEDIPVPVEMPAATPRRHLLTAGRWWLPAAAAAGLVLGSFYLWQAPHRAAEVVDLEATSGRVVRNVNLPDGSLMRLNVDSRTDVHYSDAERRVFLMQGEAHFTVAKNAARPFLVNVAGVEIRAIGTAFNVQLNANQVEVLVTEGHVRLSDPAAGVQPQGSQRSLPDLQAGDKAIIQIFRGAPAQAPGVREVQVVRMDPAAVKEALAWQQPNLIFDGTPLGTIVEKINQRATTKLIIDDQRLRDERFGGTFLEGDSDAVVRMLVENYHVVAESRDGAIHLKLKDTSGVSPR